MSRRLLTFAVALVATLLLGIPFALSSWAVPQPPAWTLPTGLETHMNTNVDITGASVTSPQGNDLGVFVNLTHGKLKVNNPPNTSMCPVTPANGTFCFYTDPTNFAVPVNFRGTEAQVNQALANLTFQPDPSFPQPADGTLDATLTFSATEQIPSSPLSGNLQTTVRVDPPNQAPSFDALPGGSGLTTNENQSYDFINEIHVTDPDLYTCDPLVDVTRTLTITGTTGTWTDSYSSSSFQLTGSGTAVVVLKGDLTDINNALQNLRYHPAVNQAYDDPIGLSFDDAGCVGYPGDLLAVGGFVMHVLPGPVTHFLVTAPATVNKGASFSFDVKALDQYDQVVGTYVGPVHVTSSDGAATLPADQPLVLGQGTLAATLNTLGNQTLTVADSGNASLNGTSAAINVVNAPPPPATHYSVSAPANATAGTPVNVTVTALTAGNATATTYAGIVHFTSTDGAATLPANSALVNGVGTFQVTLATTGNQTVTATDTVTASITGTTAAINVTNAPPPPATHFSVSAPANATAGTPVNVTVTALTAGNATATAYAGIVHFTSTDGAATLPANTTLVNGVGTFQVTLATTGNQTVTATDTVTNSITGTSNQINVTNAPPPPATHFSVSAPGSAGTGVPFNVTVTALTAGNATATSYSGTVHFTSTDGAATLPANTTLVNGVGTFQVTLTTAGNQTVTATDTVTNSITGTTAAVSVAPGAPSAMKVSPPPASPTAGVPFSVTITVVDAFGNTVTSYSGTIHFTSTDPAAVLPADSTLPGGTGTFPITYNTPGAQSFMVMDTQDSQLGGESLVGSVQQAPATTTTTTTPIDTTTTTQPTDTTSSTSTSTTGVTVSSTVPATVVYTTTGTLPVTGSNSGLLALVGGLLVTGGLVLVVRSRRHG